METILAEFRKIKRTKVSPAELKKAKSYMKGTMTLALETSDAVAENAATSIINLNRVRSLEEVIKGIDKVSVDDIQRISQYLFRTDKLNLAVIGPHTDKGKLQQLLRI